MRVKRIIMCLLLWIWLGCVSVFADANVTGVVDDAGLFTGSEMNEMNSILNDAGSDMDLNFVVYTVEGITRGELHSTYQSLCGGSGSPDGVMYTIDILERKMYITEYVTDGSSYRLGDDDIDEMDDIVASASNRGSNYVAAVRAFVKETKDRAASGFRNNKGHFIKYSTVGISFIVFVVIGGIIILIMYSGQRSKKVTDGAVYMKEGSGIDILEQEDIYTHTTKQVIHHESSSGSGSGGGGSSHSSSGASF